MKSVFISHRDREVAVEVDYLIEQAFAGRVRTFNTSRHGRGLTSGDRIDPRLLDELRKASVFLSVWTPGAVRNPAWMAWELGAAAASANLLILTSRALGTPLEDLPLDLTSRFTPDIGDAEELIQLLQAIGRHVEEPPDLAVARHEFSRWEDGPSPLTANLVEDCVVLTVHGERRGLLENRTDRRLTEMRVEAMADDQASNAVAEAVTAALKNRGTGADRGSLDPAGRVVFNLRSSPDRPEGTAFLRMRWLASGEGREEQRAEVHIERV